MERGKILIVEDDHQIRETLQQVLEIEGYPTLTAEHGEAALRTLRNSNGDGAPRLILLDLMMPVMNGWELLKALSGDQVLSTIPVVVFSAAVDSSEGLEHARAFMKKPLNLDALLSLVQQYCGE